MKLALPIGGLEIAVEEELSLWRGTTSYRIKVKEQTLDTVYGEYPTSASIREKLIGWLKWQVQQLEKMDAR